jgi:hypothetical protein
MELLICIGLGSFVLGMLAGHRFLPPRVAPTGSADR